MVSEKINENMTRTTVSLITFKLKDIFYNLINDMCDLYERETKGEIPPELIPAVNRVREYVHRISEELNKELDDRSEYIDELNSLKEEYVSACLPLLLQMQAVENLKSYTQYVLACNTLKKEDEEEYHNISHMVYEHVEDFLAGSDNEYELHMTMGFIASRLPLRMTRENYGDRIRAGLKEEIAAVKEGDPQVVTSILEFNCFPQLCRGYGDISKENTQAISGLYNEDIAGYTDEELEEYADRIDQLFGDMSDMTESLNIAYNDINYMLALAAYASGEDFLTDNDPVIRDALYSCRQMLEGHDPELIYETLGERMVGLIEDNYNASLDMEEKYEEYTGKYKEEDLAPDTRSLTDLYEYINTLYYLEISDEARLVCRADDRLKREDPAEELISMAGELTAGYGPAKSKFFKRQVFNYLPLKMSAQEFLDYYSYCLDPHSPTGENKAALADVFDLLCQETGYFDSIDDGEEPFPHEDHCTCGHEHHHHHDCSCGHEHKD